MTNISSILGGTFSPPALAPLKIDLPPDMQLIDAIERAGYTPPSRIVMDGEIHRFSATGAKRDDSGWYVAYAGDICAGSFGSWKESSAHTWRQDIGRELSMHEQLEHKRRMADARAASEKARALKQGAAADTAEAIYSNATAATDDHPYLIKKGVKAHDIRVTGDGRLIIPMISPSGELSSVQFIDSEGEKKYLSGGQSKNSHFMLGIVKADQTVYIAEGYATASSIYETTGRATVVAFSAGNLDAVAQMVRSHHKGEIVIVADNDESGTGSREADKAALNSRARVVIPPTRGDANDYAQDGNDLSALLSPPEQDDWLVPADSFCEQPSPIRWLIKNHLQREALIMVHGPSGGGKTFVVLDMCLSIASGRSEWCGNIVRPGPVVYLAGEGHHGLRGRTAAWKQFHRVDKLDMWLSKSGTDLNTAEGYNRVRQAILSLPHPPALVVVDTLHRFLSGDENSAQDAKTMLDACNLIQQEFGCSVLLVHHTGVSEEAQHRARGSSAWKGALDIEISIVPGIDGKPLEIVQRKSKDAEMAEPIYMRITSVPLPWLDEDGDAVTSAVVVQDDYEPESKSKVSSVVMNARKSFEGAWMMSGELLDGQPYLTSSAWQRFYESQADDKTPAAMKKEFQRLRERIIEDDYAEPVRSGFMVKHGISAISMKLAKM
jgi:putative DNA primase/helicase